jgi:hypothetical protein
MGEDRVGVGVLDERADSLDRVEREERGAIGDARRLLHVVGDDHDRVARLEPVQQLLDRGGRDRVERRCGLIEQQDIRLDCDRARDAQPLLLAARQRERVRLQPVLHLVPDRRVAQRPLHALVHVALHTEVARRPGDVVVDRLGERVGLLEDHPDPPPDLDPVGPAGIHVVAVVEHLTADAEAGDRVVHPVQRADERRLAAAGRPDQRGHEVAVDPHRDVVERGFSP